MSFNDGSNSMSQHLDNVYEHGINVLGKTESEAAFYALTQFLAFLADPDHLEKAFEQNPAVAVVGTINIVRWAYEWAYVKQAALVLPESVEEVV